MTQNPTAQELSAHSPTLHHEDKEQLLPQLVAHLREHRSRLRQDWAARINEAHLLEAMTPQEMAAETTSVYDNYVEVLETGSVEALQHYARDLSERIIPRGWKRTKSWVSCSCCVTCLRVRCSRSTSAILHCSIGFWMPTSRPRTGSPIRWR